MPDKIHQTSSLQVIRLLREDQRESLESDSKPVELGFVSNAGEKLLQDDSRNGEWKTVMHERGEANNYG